MRGILEGHNVDVFNQAVDDWAQHIQETEQFQHAYLTQSPTLAWKIINQSLRPLALEVFGNAKLHSPHKERYLD